MWSCASKKLEPELRAILAEQAAPQTVEQIVQQRAGLMFVGNLAAQELANFRQRIFTRTGARHDLYDSVLDRAVRHVQHKGVGHLVRLETGERGGVRDGQCRSDAFLEPRTDAVALRGHGTSLSVSRLRSTGSGSH